MSDLAGLYAALATPYTGSDEIDESGVRDLVQFVLRGGSDGVYVGGSTGESLLQTTAERQRVLRIVANECRGHAKVIGQVGALSTNESRLLARTCAEEGYDAISAIPPIYYPYSKENIRSYYEAIVEAASGVPLVLYNIPAMSGIKFSLSDLAELLELPDVVGVKQTVVDMYQMEQLRRLYPGLLLLNRYDEVFLAAIVSGANGSVGSTFNIMAWRYRELWRLIESGENTAALELQGRCNQVIDLLLKGGVFPSIKFILYKMGVIKTPHCRSPLGTLKDQQQTAELARVADELSSESQKDGVAPSRKRCTTQCN